MIGMIILNNGILLTNHKNKCSLVFGMLEESNNFINQYYLSDSSICDDLITLFKNSKNKSKGQIGKGIDKKIKDSTDLLLWDGDIPQSKILINYFKQLNECLNLYKNLTKIKLEIKLLRNIF